MINEAYKAMLTGKSVIRELNEYANDTTAHPHLRPEDIFDFSLGNPSVPVPDAFNLRIKELLDHGDPMLVHGYSPSLGIPSVREKIAASLNHRFGMNYTMNDIFMTSGAAGALAHAIRLVTKPGDDILTFAICASFPPTPRISKSTLRNLSACSPRPFRRFSSTRPTTRPARSILRKRSRTWRRCSRKRSAISDTRSG